MVANATNLTSVPSTNGNLSTADDHSQYVLFIFWGIITPIIAAFGFVGNFLTVMVLFRSEMASSTIYYLRALVVTDTIFLTMTVGTLTPFSLVHVSPSFLHYRFVIYPKVFIFFNYVIMTTQMCNVWITVSVSFERFIYICYPFRASRWISTRTTLTVIIGVCVVSSVYNLPRVFAYEWDPCKKGTCREPDLNDYFGETSAYKRVYLIWLYIVVVFLVPLTSLCVLCWFVVRELMRMRRRRSRTHLENDHEKSMTMALGMIVAVFVLCQTLGLVAQFDELTTFVVFIKILAVSNTLYVVNSSVTFYIYLAVGKKFRTVLTEKILSRCRCGRRKLRRPDVRLYRLSTSTQNGLTVAAELP